MIQHETFNQMLNNPVRELKGRVELYIYEDSTLTQVCGCHDSLQSFSIERVGENKFFGYGICQKLTVSLIDRDRSTNISTANYLEAVFGVDSDYLYPFPAFYVSEVHRDENTNKLSVTAYDALYKANKHTVSELEITAPYTIRQFITACADLLGLPLNVASDNTAFDLAYANGANFDGTETIREALNAVAEVTQTIYFIDKNWELTFKSLDKDGQPALTISKDTYFTLDSKTNRRLSTICHTTELGDNVSASITETGTTQYVRDNPFWNLRDDVGDLLQDAINRVGGFTINQFECQWRGNWLLEIGDKIALQTKDNNIVTSYFLNDVVTYNGTLSEKTQWNYDDNDEETASNPATIGDAIKQTYAKVDKINKTIELVASDVTENKESISKLELDTDSINASVQELSKSTNDGFSTVDERFAGLDIELDGINASVSSLEESTNGEITTLKENIAALEISTDNINASVQSLEQVNNDTFDSINGEIEELTKKVEASITSEEVKLEIQTQLTDGVTKVETNTGFTFNDEGLTVEKSGSEMSTQITEDGMTVYKNNEAVLTANNVGVDAVNLHASTYLIIGTNSRFEDYGSRTGCFWIGG